MLRATRILPTLIPNNEETLKLSMCMDVQIYLEEQRLQSLNVGARITDGYVLTQRGTKAQTYCKRCSATSRRLLQSQ